MTNTSDPNRTTADNADKDGGPTATSGCCGGPATSNASACCARDEESKAIGGSGCGCRAKPVAARSTCC
jgi:hypothetical protein